MKFVYRPTKECEKIFNGHYDSDNLCFINQDDQNICKVGSYYFLIRLNIIIVNSFKPDEYNFGNSKTKNYIQKTL